MSSIFNNEFQLKEDIGRGPNGTVKKAIKTLGGLAYAIKFPTRLTRTQLAKKVKYEFSEDDLEFVEPYENLYEDNHEFKLTMKYFPYGSIDKYIQNKGLNEPLIRDILICILFGLNSLHKHKIIHFNLKPSNVFLSEKGIVKLGDLVLSMKEDSVKEESYFSTSKYSAPEVDEHSSQISTKCDIWSLGVLLTELVVGNHSFAEMSDNDFKNDLKHGKCVLLDNANLKPDFIDFIKLCLKTDPKERPSVEQLLDNPYVVDNVLNIFINNQSDEIMHWKETLPKPANDFNIHISSTLESIEVDIILKTKKKTVDQCSQLLKIDGQIEELMVKSNCDESFIKRWDIQQFIALETLVIGDNCLNYVIKFELVQSNLKSIKIGQNCYRRCNAFLLKNNTNLKSIEIGRNCYRQCNEFLLQNNTNLKSIEIGKKSFQHCTSCCIQDSPDLTEFKLDNNVFEGDNNRNNSLCLNNLNNLENIQGANGVFRNITIIDFKNLLNLNSYLLPDAFEHVVFTKQLKDVSDTLKGNRYIIRGIHDAKPETRNDWNKLNENINSITVQDNALTYIRLNNLEQVAKCTFLEKLIIGNNCLHFVNKVKIEKLNNLEEIIIGNNCFRFTQSIVIKELESLKTIKIGDNCFTEPTEAPSSFICSDNCNLESLTIGTMSFQHYTKCELQNLPQLVSLQIGDWEKESRNFEEADCIIRGFEALESIVIGQTSFAFLEKAEFSNLENLKEIKLGKDSLTYTGLSTSELQMKNLPELTTLISKGSSFEDCKTVIFENIPKLTEVELEDAFVDCKLETNNISEQLESILPLKTNKSYCSIL